jgi:Lon protease-like protein
MTDPNNLSQLPADFRGTVRLFPLPNLVLFPHVMQPLHIFEPRYRAMLEDALAGDGLIAMAVLAPGWEKDYEGRPPLYSHACLARVATHHRLDDGTYNLLVLGLRRVQIEAELPPLRLFREARVTICDDLCPAPDAAGRDAAIRKLRQALLRVVPLLPDAKEQLDHLFGADVSLGTLTDVIAYMLEMDVPAKMALLGEVDVARRAEALLAQMASASDDDSSGGAFPPPFSAN